MKTITKLSGACLAFLMKINSGMLTSILTALIVPCCIHLNAQTPGTALDTLNISNVSTVITNNGNMFWDGKHDTAGYEVPKGSGKHTIFASALWVGGLDAGNKLHIAAQTYRQSGNDFWPGPIDTAGHAAVSSQWDSVWRVDKSTIDYHIHHWNDSGYVMPAEIADWPANGKPPFAKVLAPFADLNGDLIYEPALGEYPAIFGDQATYDIFNDVANTHTETGGVPLGIEVHQMSYEINSPTDSFLTNTVFMRYEIGNRSDTDYHDVYIGIWTDFDIGYPNDDYVGTDVGRNMYYGYNGEAVDPGPGGYGANPPAQGVLFLNHTLTHSQYYNNNFTVTGNPFTATEYYNYMRSIWIDGLHVTYGGNGHDSTNLDTCNYMFPDTTDPLYFSKLGAWSEITAGDQPGDRRMSGSFGPLSLPADSFLVIDVAFTYARGDSGAWSSVVALQRAADSINARYANGSLTSIFTAVPYINKNVENITVYPNPADDHVTLAFNNTLHERFMLKIFDMAGREVMRMENIYPGKLTFSVKNLAAGVFLLQLQSDKNVYSGKIVKR